MTSGALLNLSKFPLIYGHALRDSGALSALELQPQALTFPCCHFSVSFCSVLCPIGTEQGLLFKLPAHTCTSARAHCPEKGFNGNKTGWEGKSRCRTNLSRLPARFSQAPREHSAGFVPSVQNNTTWVYLAVVKEVYKQMNLFLAVLELPVKFKQHPMSGTGISK